MKQFHEEEVTFEYKDNTGQWIERNISEITSISKDSWQDDLNKLPLVYGVLVGLLSRMKSIRDEESMKFDVWFSQAMEILGVDLPKNASVTQRQNRVLSDETKEGEYRKYKANIRRLDKSIESITGLMKAVEMKSKNQNTIGFYQSELKAIEKNMKI